MIPRLPDGRPVEPAAAKPKPKPSPTVPQFSTPWYPELVSDAQDTLQQAIQADTVLGTVGGQTITLADVAEGTPAAEWASSSSGIEDARQQLADALTIEQGHAFGRDNPMQPDQKVNRLTQAEYNALSFDQRQAIDFNTSLVRAVRRDRRNQDEYANTTALEEKAYSDLHDKIFGEQAAEPDMFAPETLAVLDQLGYQDPQARLEDFTSLSAAIRRKDVERLGATEGEPIPRTRPRLVEGPEYGRMTSIRMGLAETLVNHQQALSEALANGNKLLGSLTVKTAALDRADTVDEIGGQAVTGQDRPGYGNSKLDAYFRDAFEFASNSNVNPDDLLRALYNELNPQERRQFMTYAQQRITEAVQQKLPLGQQEGVVYRNPMQVSRLLGLVDGAKEGGA